LEVQLMGCMSLSTVILYFQVWQESTSWLNSDIYLQNYVTIHEPSRDAANRFAMFVDYWRSTNTYALHVVAYHHQNSLAFPLKSKNIWALFGFGLLPCFSAGRFLQFWCRSVRKRRSSLSGYPRLCFVSLFSYPI
jgi:uncharacterized protein Usg